MAAYATINEEIETAIAHLQAKKWARIQDLMRSKGSKEKYSSAFLQKKYEELLENPEPVSATKDTEPAPLAVIPTNHWDSTTSNRSSTVMSTDHRESTNSNRSSVVFPHYPECTSSDNPSEDEGDARTGIASRDSRAKAVVRKGKVLLAVTKKSNDVIAIKKEDDVKQEELEDPSILKTENWWHWLLIENGVFESVEMGGSKAR